MLILKAQNVVSEGIPIVYVYQMHQQNGSFAQNVDSEDIPGSTNGVNRKARNNKLDGDRAPPTSTNVLIYKMGWPPRLQFLAPFHISCNPDINKVGNRSYMPKVVFLDFHFYDNVEILRWLFRLSKRKIKITKRLPSNSTQEKQPIIHVRPIVYCKLSLIVAIHGHLPV